MTLRSAPSALASLALVLAACGGGDGNAADTARATDTAAAAQPAATARRIATIEGFSTPESAKYDADQDVWFVSNINGVPSAKDNNGFIARVNASTGAVDSLRFVAGGRGNVTLHAPKGMAIVGDTLWVADIDALRGFDKRTGQPVGTVDMAGMNAAFLNDVAVGGDGALYITDTGIRITASGMEDLKADKIFKVAGRTASVALRAEGFGHPNGITWDQANDRFVVVPFGKTDVLSWRPGDTTSTTLATGPGSFDGVELLADGRLLVSSWADSAVTLFSRPAAGGTMTGTRLITNVPAPADIGLDARRSRVAVPLFNANRVEVFEIQ